MEIAKTKNKAEGVSFLKTRTFGSVLPGSANRGTMQLSNKDDTLNLNWQWNL